MRVLSALLLLMFPASGAMAQALTTYVGNGDTAYVRLCRFDRGTVEFVVDTAGGVVSNNYDCVVFFDFEERFIRLTSLFYFGTGTNFPNSSVELVGVGFTNDQLIPLSHQNISRYDTLRGGTYGLHLHLSSADSLRNHTFRVVWQADSLASTCQYMLRNLNVTNIGASTAWVHWTSSTDSIAIEYGSGRSLALGGSKLLFGLSPNTEYTVTINTWADMVERCCELKKTFTTLATEPPVCIDATDTASPFVTYCYGTAEHPLDSVGRDGVRHVLMDDTTRHDPAIPALRTVPPGHTSSMRLGNMRVGAQGEGIVFLMRVDTLEYDILMLKYAAVLQVPDHQPAQQPRFSFSIYDENMNPIDPMCGAASFVASPDMGWNMAGDKAWKDWTTIGIDLTPYHGRYLNVCLVTRDCLGGAHYGYAYFVTECFRKGITSPQCGANATASLTAPPGFNYVWYTDTVTNVISTGTTCPVTQGDTYYHCRMTYIENENCWFEMKVWSGQRFPLADFEPTIVTNDCRHFNVVMTNRSTVSNDGINPIGSGEPCEASWWDFGNGETSNEYNPTAYYDTNGTYTVTLVSSVGGGQCKDTLVRNITLPTFVNFEEYASRCDSFLWWRDGQTYYYDTVGPIDLHPAPNGCDTAYALHLTVHHSTVNVLDRDTSCWSIPYTWHGHTFSDTNSVLRSDWLGDTLKTVHGCDSMVAIEVLRYPKLPIEFSAEADCHIKQYRLEADVDAPFIRWSSTPVDPALDGHINDSVLTLSPDEVTTYSLTASFSHDEWCPTTESITLSPVSFPTALMRIDQEYMTLDNMEFDAYDVGVDGDLRNWTVREYSRGIVNNIYKPAPERHIHCLVTPETDSVVVGLGVTNGFCDDTTWASLPLIRTTIWAPNVFMPNGFDNNRFQIFSTGLLEAELHIYNREGMLMYHTKDLEQPWDGKHNGRLCEQGAYAWKLLYVSADFPEKPQVAVGTVMLLR